MEIKRKELQMEAELIKKKLAWETAVIEESDHESLADNTNIEERVDTWLTQNAATLAERSKKTSREALRQNPTDTRGEPEAQTKDEHQRRRSITPGRSRGIEQLTDTLQNMMKVRPPPRQATELPIFTGAVAEWLPFKAAMLETTQLYNFTAVENIARLRNCLKGDAREAVSSLLATTTDPAVILKTLEQCFGRPEVIIDQALEQLRRLPKQGPTATDLNNIAVKLQNIVCVLKQLDKRGYLNNPMLTREVVSKLSPHIAARWCDFAEEFGTYSEPEIITLSKFLMREADRALRHAYSPAPWAPAVKREERKAHTTAPLRRAAIHNVTEDNEKTSCYCCKKEHELPKCPKFAAMSINERWQLVKDEKVCFKCITKKHRRLSCRAKPCDKGDCRRPHHHLLHHDAASAPPPITNAETNYCNEASFETVAATDTTIENRRVLLKVCPVIIKGPAGEIKTYALLDEGSTISLIDRDAANSIRADGPTQSIHLHGVNTVMNEKKSKRVKLQVRGLNTDYFDLEARTIDGINIASQTVPESILKYPHLQKLEAKEVCYDLARPQLLIGADYWHLIVTRQLRAGKRSQPVATRTSLGWVILGGTPRTIVNEDHATVVHLQLTENSSRSTNNERLEDERLHDLIKEHYEIDSLGISLKKPTKPEDERASDIIKRTTRHVNGRYEVGLPWRTDNVKMPPSYDNAMKRLKGIEKKMDRDPAFATEYSMQIQNLLDKGYAARCDGSEDTSCKRWFLPHFAVRNPNKPGKTRLVFDAAAVTNDVSLNQELLEGPDLLTSLQGILYRFREKKVAVTADIQEMFLQIKIHKEDQPAQLFLWRGRDRSKPPQKYKMTSMIFGAACSPFIAHSIRNMNAHAHARTHPEALKAITESHYMDDYVDSYSDEEEATVVTQSVTKVHVRAGFRLRGWNSNSPRVLAGTADELKAQSLTPLGTSMNTYEKTLGLLWDAAEDVLKFNTTMARVRREVKEQLRPPTKRETLSAVMSIYDPLGLLSPYTITAKIFLQQLWRLKLDWDDPLPDEDAETFQLWLQGLKSMAAITIPRCYHPEPTTRRELHVFCDASDSAYAAVAYWRLSTTDGGARTALIGGKAKVAPLKAQSIPRLELQAALIGTRLADTIKNEHRWEVHDTIFWSDSTTVLTWIRNGSRKYTAFVAHRLGEIAERTAPSQWRWVPTDLNVADDATRSKYVDTVPERWLSGPPFLRCNREEWPSADSSDVEDWGEHADVTHTSLSREAYYEAMPDAARISKYECLIRTTALVLLAVDKLHQRATTLDLNHLTKAEDMWLRRAQQESFGEDLRRLKEGKPIPRTSRLYRLDPEIEDGLLRVRGRVDAATVAATVKRPIILDGRHYVTKMLVAREHEAAGHANNERVVNELRQRFWVIKLRPAVRAAAHACKRCKIRKTQPATPSMGNLPRERLCPYSRPFTNCGLDYFGPMTVTIGRRHEKRWGALFTCLTTRAVHMELVASLSTDSAIMALRRMAARRGWPSRIVSDNGTNFKGADKELRAAIEEWAPHLHDYLLTRRVQWRFIPPGAPNQGGAWERLVRSIKTALAVTLNERAPKEEVLQTLMTEAEHSVNTRPLTHVSVSSEDEESLTPNHFLMGTSSGLPLTGPCQPGDRRQWRAAQELADRFWQRWLKEYLPTLVPRGEPGKAASLNKGDLVIVVDPNLPRNVWPRGVVQRVHPGPDGEVRSADVRTKGGTFHRPTRKLIVLANTNGPQLLNSSSAPPPDQRGGTRCDPEVAVLP